MSVAAVVIVALAGLAYVIAPLFKQDDADQGADGRIADAEHRKARSLEAILDLEDDLAGGKITADEVAVLRSEHERDAIEALRELDVLEMTTTEDALEAAIAAERARIACPVCGARRTEDERCPSCGA
jgi:rubrerythrin